MWDLSGVLAVVGQDTRSAGYSDGDEGPVNFRGVTGEMPACKPCKKSWPKATLKWAQTSCATERKSIACRPARIGMMTRFASSIAAVSPSCSRNAANTAAAVHSERTSGMTFDRLAQSKGWKWSRITLAAAAATTATKNLPKGTGDAQHSVNYHGPASDQPGAGFCASGFCARKAKRQPQAGGQSINQRKTKAGSSRQSPDSAPEPETAGCQRHGQAGPRLTTGGTPRHPAAKVGAGCNWPVTTGRLQRMLSDRTSLFFRAVVTNPQRVTWRQNGTFRPPSQMRLAANRSQTDAGASHPISAIAYRAASKDAARAS